MLKAILRQACPELVEVAHNELSGSPPPLVVSLSNHCMR